MDIKKEIWLEAHEALHRNNLIAYNIAMEKLKDICQKERSDWYNFLYVLSSSFAIYEIKL